jgi:hypothetical protein
MIGTISKHDPANPTTVPQNLKGIKLGSQVACRQT